MSVVMEKCVAAYHDDATASSSAAAKTGQAYCPQKSIARTTRAVIIFMGSAEWGQQNGGSRMGAVEWDGQRDGWIVSRTNSRLRRQEKGKIEALCSASSPPSIRRAHRLPAIHATSWA